MHRIKIRGVRMALAIAASLLLLAAPALGDDQPLEEARWRALDAGFPQAGKNSHWISAGWHPSFTRK